MKTSKVNLLSPIECKTMCEYFEERKEKFKMSTENGESYISAYESNLEKDFSDVHEFLEEKITKKILCSTHYKFYSISVKKSFACRYTTTTSPSMPFHYDGDDLTVLIYLNNNFEKVLILRHDVDKRPQNSLRTAQLQHKLGVKGTYYFRAVPESFDVDVIKRIAALGHEIGYHYEDLTICKGDYEKAIIHFEKWLKC